MKKNIRNIIIFCLVVFLGWIGFLFLNMSTFDGFWITDWEEYSTYSRLVKKEGDNVPWVTISEDMKKYTIIPLLLHVKKIRSTNSLVFDDLSHVNDKKFVLESLQVDKLKVVHPDGSEDVIISGSEPLEDRKFIIRNWKLYYLNNLNQALSTEFDYRKDNIAIYFQGIAFSNDGREDNFLLETKWLFGKNKKIKPVITYHGP